MLKATDQDLYSKLDERGIAYEVYEHPPVYTVEEARQHAPVLPGADVKNLFLRNKKKTQLFLLTVLSDKVVNMKALEDALNVSGRLSFGSADLLADTLGVSPGSVTPFAMINDTAHRVSFYMDNDIKQSTHIHPHPLRNDRTISLRVVDLITFLEQDGHTVNWLGTVNK